MEFSNDNIFGRPIDQPKERNFIVNLRNNQERFDLECLVLKEVYHSFFQQNSQNIDENALVSFFFSERMQRIYHIISEAPKTKIQDQNLLNKYICSQDILYWFHLIKQPNAQITYLQPKQVFLIILAYLNKQKLVNRSFFQFYRQCIDDKVLERIMLRGPTQHPQYRHHNLLVLIVHWSLSLIQKQGNIMIRTHNNIERWQRHQDLSLENDY